MCDVSMVTGNTVPECPVGSHLEYQEVETMEMVRMIGDEFLTEERDRKYYADHYTCCPPPLFIILITLVEVSRSNYPTP
ncbi:RHBL3 protein, partial [Acromyrmex insinuator]